MSLRVARHRVGANHAGLREMLALVALTLPSRAMASRELDSLSIVPTMFGAILRDAFGSMLIAAAIIAALVIPWWLLRAHRSAHPRPHG